MRQGREEASARWIDDYMILEGRCGAVLLMTFRKLYRACPRVVLPESWRLEYLFTIFNLSLVEGYSSEN